MVKAVAADVKDISNIMRDAIEKSDNYNSRNISKDMEQEFHQVWCRLEDDSNWNWYLISETDGITVKKYWGYLSKKYPIAFLYDSCPEEIRYFLQRKRIIMEKYQDRYSCEETILKQYVSHMKMIDDRFLYDETIPFDEEKFLEIDTGIEYINPMNFSFESIK